MESTRVGKNFIYDSGDLTIFREIMTSLADGRAGILFPGDRVAAAGRAFLDTPYESRTLEQEGPEKLTVTLREVDCFTLVEQAVVLGRLIRTGKADFAEYAAALQRVRYRKGMIDGYASRLHYFSDWLADAEEKGFLSNITAALGGRRLEKRISFMTDHAGRYPALGDGEVLRRMREIEEGISSRPIVFIPRESVRAVEDQLREGDLVAITTDEEGLDVSHVGIAVRQRRRVHLLHASSRAGRVLISPETLYGYLMEKKGRTGVMAARPL